jgi:hypothetical protein
MRRRVVTVVAALAATMVCIAPSGLRASDRAHVSSTAASDNVVLLWNSALLQAISLRVFPPTPSARALAIVHTAMYDAWAAYDRSALGVHWTRELQRPEHEHTTHNKEVAISVAAYRSLADVFPAEIAGRFDPLMASLGLDPRDDSLDPNTPVGIGNLAAAAVLAFRHKDGSNQLGDLNGGAPYSDYTGYLSVNTPEQLSDPNRWQPLRSPTGAVQQFLTPHWRLVIPFALASLQQLRPSPPAPLSERAYYDEAEAVRSLSAGLSDRDKVIAEYWADGPMTVTPPGHWNLMAQFVSQRDGHTLDQDVKMFFALGNALLDASIAVWECKLYFDYVRPVTAIRFLFANRPIEAWGGPFQGTRLIQGQDFRSYIATPPFAEYTSGHSAFSSASAEVLKRFTGSPLLGASYTFKAGTSTIEPGAVPASDIVLSWTTFEEAAEQAGFSRRLGGIHFRQGDVESREMGKRIGQIVWDKALNYFNSPQQAAEKRGLKEERRKPN